MGAESGSRGCNKGPLVEALGARRAAPGSELLGKGESGLGPRAAGRGRAGERRQGDRGAGGSCGASLLSAAGRGRGRDRAGRAPEGVCVLAANCRGRSPAQSRTADGDMLPIPTCLGSDRRGTGCHVRGELIFSEAGLPARYANKHLAKPLGKQ